MNIYISVLAAVLTSANCANGAGTVKFYYDEQSKWPLVPAPGGSNNECARKHASGIGQSPINIQTMDTCSVLEEGYKFFAGDCTVDDYKFSINDHGVKAEIIGTECIRPGMFIPGMNKLYEVLQLHIHTGCEHNMDGAGCDAELHIVHVAKSPVEAAAATGGDSSVPDLAVVGIMMSGGDNYEEALEPLLESWSSVSCVDECEAQVDELHKDSALNPYSFLASGTDFYKYVGGLTTPPCWEVVNWNVAALPMKISWRQILSLSNLVNNYSGYRDGSNACVEDTTVASVAGLTGRQTQPILGRQVQRVCEPYIMSKEIPEFDVNIGMTKEANVRDEQDSKVKSSAWRRNVGLASIIGTVAIILL